MISVTTSPTPLHSSLLMPLKVANQLNHMLTTSMQVMNLSLLSSRQLLEKPFTPLTVLGYLSLAWINNKILQLIKSSS